MSRTIGRWAVVLIEKVRSVTTDPLRDMWGGKPP